MKDLLSIVTNGSRFVRTQRVRKHYNSDVVVRTERVEDHAAIRAVNEAAFGGSEEADIVAKLRAEGGVIVSLAAEVDGTIAGHILFSRMWIDTPAQSVPAAALAPMAVLPEFQRRGIGARLIREGLGELRQRDERIVIVVGHPEYYPRFGFSSEMARCLDSPFPHDAFMALELVPGALNGIRGRVRYAEAFGLMTSDHKLSDNTETNARDNRLKRA